MLVSSTLIVRYLLLQHHKVSKKFIQRWSKTSWSGSCWLPDLPRRLVQVTMTLPMRSSWTVSPGENASFFGGSRCWLILHSESICYIMGQNEETSKTWISNLSKSRSSNCKGVFYIRRENNRASCYGDGAVRKGGQPQWPNRAGESIIRFLCRLEVCSAKMGGVAFTHTCYHASASIL